MSTPLVIKDSKIVQMQYGPVSNANQNFSTGVSFWKLRQMSGAGSNVHFITGIPLCSNDIIKYRLALYHLYGKEFVAINAPKLQRLEIAIRNKHPFAEIS